MTTKPDFTIKSRSTLGDDGVWLIEARVVFREGLAAEQRRKLLGLVRATLLQRILTEGVRAWSLGAVRARVVMDDGTGERTIDPDELHPNLGLTN